LSSQVGIPIGRFSRTLVEAIDQAEAIFVFEDKRIRGTPGALAGFTLNDTQFSLAD
jgi:hypothetical protein